MRFLKSGLVLVTLAISTNVLAQSIADMGEQAKEMVAEIKSINQEINMLATEAQQSNDSVLIQCEFNIFSAWSFH